MSWFEFYTELKSWQGAIGAVFGFIALISGALFNFHLNRKRDERLRSEEVVAIASALYGEIVLLRQSVARLANAVGGSYMRHGFHGDQPIDKHFVEQFALPKPKLYPALASKVGMLHSQLALEVVQFYSRVEEVETWFPRLTDDDERPYSYDVGYVLDPAIDAVNGVTPTLRIIENMAGIVKEASTPDLKKALDAQELQGLQNQN